MSSLVFVVAALVEFSVVLFLSYHVAERKNGDRQNGNHDLEGKLRQTLTKCKRVKNVRVNDKPDIQALNMVPFTKSCFGSAGSMRKIDYIAFWIFFTSYVVFIWMYWSILSSK